MKGDVELETVAKWVVLLVILGLAIAMTYYIYDHTKEALNDASKDKYNSSIIKAASFSQSQMNLYIRSCAEKTAERKDEDFTCFILEGDMSKISVQNLSNACSNCKLDVSDFHNERGVASITYDSMSKTIFVKN